MRKVVYKKALSFIGGDVHVCYETGGDSGAVMSMATTNINMVLTSWCQQTDYIYIFNLKKEKGYLIVRGHMEISHYVNTGFFFFFYIDRYDK